VESSPLLSRISFSDFLDQVQDGLYVVDTELTIVFWNRAAEELTGFSAAQMVGRSCMDPDVLGQTTILGESITSGESSPLVRCMVTDVGGTVPQLILMKSASGRPLPVSLSVGPLHSSDGESIGAIALFRGMREEYQQRRLAIEIQKRMITREGFERNGVRTETLYAPVDELGGDFLETFFLDERTLIATIADATGHGISASLFTMVYKTLLHSSFARHHGPGMVLDSVNRGFLETAGVDGFYIGACLVSYDTVTHRGAYAAAGHPRGLIFTPAQGGYALREKLAIQSLMLGVDERARFGEVGFSLGPGDFLLITSDGLLEAPCADGGQFGLNGVEDFFGRYAGTALLADLHAEVRRRSVFHPLPDDVSAVLLAPR
jgi:phosphoserine phosphatase RsbU/P